MYSQGPYTAMLALLTQGKWVSSVIPATIQCCEKQLCLS